MVSRLQFYWVVVAPAAVLMALEIVSSRVLAPQFGSSVYVWGSIIGVFLAAMSVGYALGGWLADRWPSLAHLGRLLLGAAFAQTVILLAGRPVVAALGELTGGSPTGTLLATALLFGPSTVLLATVSPYAVKLATRDLSLLGGTAGHLYAISTAASLVGTLGATFVLIPHLGIDVILRLLLMLTAATSLVALVSGRRERVTVAAAVALVALAVLPLGREADAGVLADRITPYQTLKVVESDGVRYMYSDGTLHSTVILDSGEPWLIYPRYAAAALLLRPETASMLVLGMGGGSAGSYLERRLPALAVDYVEIDPAVPELAREYLLFEDGRGTVHIDDGRRFLAAQGGRRWDFVYCDTYIGSSIPFHLSTVEFFREVRQHLEPGGGLGINVASGLDNPFTRAMLRSLREVFAQVLIFAVPQGNLLLLAADLSDAPDRGELLARARDLDARYGLDPSLEAIAGRLRQPDLDLSDAVVLTDAYAPVNHLVRFDRFDPLSGKEQD